MNRTERNSAYLNELTKLHLVLGIFAISTIGKLIIEVPKYRLINRFRLTKHGEVLSDIKELKIKTLEVPDDHAAYVNINGINWLFRDKSSSSSEVKGEIRIGGKMAKHGTRIHMRKGARVEIGQDNTLVMRDGIIVRFE